MEQVSHAGAVRSVDETFREELGSLVNTLLDNYYDEHPNYTGVRWSYTHPNYPDGTLHVGRENGVDGAESDVGFDWFYRKFRDLEEPQEEVYEYIYGQYGWMDPNNLIDELPLIRDFIEWGVAQGWLDEQAPERFGSAVEQFHDHFRHVRNQFDLDDIEQLLVANDMETLRPLLCHGEEERRSIWQLLHSKDETGDIIDNPVEVPVNSPRDHFLFARSERYYYDDQTGEAKHYPYGVVIGYDDTPQRFFVHRINSEADLRADDTQWTPEMIREKMGFEYNRWDINLEDMPMRKRVRMQGDIAMVRYDYEMMVETAVEDGLESTLARIWRENLGRGDDIAISEHPQYGGDDRIDFWRYSNNVDIRVDSTDELQQLQDDIGIDESTVREHQEERGWQRLTAGRRKEIVEDIIWNEAIKWLLDTRTDDTYADLRQDERENVFEEFEDVHDSSEMVGNHILMLKNVQTRLRLPGDGDDPPRLVVIVPPSTAGDSVIGFLHDEHENVTFNPAPGVYAVRFLDGFEDQWWMDNN